MDRNNNLDLIFLTLDTHFKVTGINKTGCKLLGYSADEIIGKDLFEHFVPHDKGPRLRALCSRLMQTDPKKLEQFENAVKTSNGSTRIIRWHNSLLYDGNGRIAGAVSMGRDITGSRHARENKVQKEQEKRSQVLSAALDAQEKERRMIAEELHENVTQMLATCKLLLENEEEGKTPSQISKATEYLQQVINQVRTLSHWLNPMQLSEIGLEASILEMIQDLCPTGMPVITLSVNNPRALRQLDGDVQLSLFRIIQEQGSNIVRHSGATMATIIIRVSPHKVELEISDNGQGFDPQKTPYGLGLRNINSRAENHGGTMKLEAEPSKGCRLNVHLPILS